MLRVNGCGGDEEEFCVVGEVLRCQLHALEVKFLVVVFVASSGGGHEDDGVKVFADRGPGIFFRDVGGDSAEAFFCEGIGGLPASNPECEVAAVFAKPVGDVTADVSGPDEEDVLREGGHVFVAGFFCSF